MQQTVSARTPAHLWIVGILSFLWNCFGAYDYTMTKMRGAAYIATTMPGMDANAALAWINSMPMYAQVGWALGVWLGLLGAVLLLNRSRWAVWSFRPVADWGAAEPRLSDAAGDTIARHGRPDV